MAKAQSWERVSSEMVADCTVFKVRRDRNRRDGDWRESDFHVIESADWVNMIGLTRDNDVIMVEQYRPGVEEIIMELPGGIVDEGEEPKEAALREMKEETGYTSGRWIKIGSARPNPAIQNNTVHYYLAVDCEKTEELSLDPNESVATKLVPEADVDRLIAEGRIDHSLVVAAFLYYRLYRGRASAGDAALPGAA